MTPEERAEKIAQLEELAAWAQSGEVETYVSIEQEYYSVDLGAFGEQQMEVFVEDEEYPFQVQKLFEQAPINAGELGELVEQLKADTPETADLDSVLAKMLVSSDENEARLAIALQAVVNLAREGIALFAASDTPKPWPGALRPEIDYTAEDFPQRYLPPPGYVWGKPGPAAAESAEDAVCSEATAVLERGWVLDHKGRVRWRINGDDPFRDGYRWHVYAGERDGLPAAKAHGGETPSWAIDQYGLLIDEPHLGSYRDKPYGIWPTSAEGEAAEATLRKLLSKKVITSAFAPPAPVKV